MKRSQHIFFLSFVSAYRSSKPYIIVNYTRAAIQACSALLSLGLVLDFESVDNVNKLSLSRVNIQKRSHYIIIWLNLQPISTNTRNINFSHVGRAFTDQLTYTRGVHKMEIIYTSVRRQRDFISYKKLTTLKPHFNTIYLLETKRGIIHSEEAKIFKIGGFPILKISLLLKTYEKISFKRCLIKQMQKHLDLESRMIEILKLMAHLKIFIWMKN